MHCAFFSLMEKFDAEKEVARLKAITRLRRQKKPSRSRLDKFKAEILSLHKAKATLTEIQIFLADRRLRCDVSTIHRWLKKHASAKRKNLPENS